MSAHGRLVLVVEDSAEDREAIQRALTRSHPELELEFAPDGDAAIARLTDAGRDRPALLLLDLNLPGRDGYQVLADLRANADLAALKIIVFTSSTTSADIERCYALGADSYVYKPVNFHLFRTVLQGAVDYWRNGAG
ncbi:response regulator [Amycolatopsis sp. NBRC 101858]|uniref:response regulator n=1 Tax=Amycolatopsis sp. NBRC 101858 TaxID=3032200 RepID=UPI0024A2DB3F|nr:response regulator [Amycolatopsis sp. NBRC 101858]GLY38073.1 response regulator [Amycolatopsis sp. NBRC 101858]